MITRPLDLGSKLRPEPRNFDFLFLVNGGLIVLFFTMLGSRFVLAPGLGVDFKLPEMAGALSSAAATDRVISVLASGQIFAEGRLSLDELRDWLKGEARKLKQPSLLVRASADVPVSKLAVIVSAAREAGFTRIILGAEDPATQSSRAP
ncbi:MAG: biopolymer transporter ExbD [Bdellovibrionota bacterium]